MFEVSRYNPLKTYNKQHIEPLFEMLSYVGEEVCYYGDEVGYFFSPLRRLNNASICFNRSNYYNFFILAKRDIVALRKTFLEYVAALDLDLLPYYEKSVYAEDRPFISAYYTMVLSQLSTNINGDYCNYISTYDNRIHNSIDKLLSFNISNNEILWGTPPKDKFLISYEKEIKTKGILITKKQTNHKLLDSVEGLNYYYVR